MELDLVLQIDPNVGKMSKNIIFPKTCLLEWMM